LAKRDYIGLTSLLAEVLRTYFAVQETCLHSVYHQSVSIED